ncbi:MAG: hypothetical protein R3185_07655, partial [Candidatus Thermoplasmatota archaeon]|nr:hypothetical protein [Candidatus Thermoplasmatota archaeon]
MGAGVAAAHLVLFLTLASVGTLLVGATTDAWRESNQAQTEAIHRLKRAAHEDLELDSQAYLPSRCINDEVPPGCQGTQIPTYVYANFTNNG